ncbi:MAG: hypothetical protein WB475_00075 [Pseudolabrys sp.]
MFYFGRSYTATRSGSTTREEKCVGCSRVFEYTITRTVEGASASFYFLNNAKAAASAEREAHFALNRALNEGEPVHCPDCGIYQPDMVRVLREQFGRHFDPNKYASERIAIPVAKAWVAALTADTKDSYIKFKEVWPTYSWYMEARPKKEIKYPPYLRKLTSDFFWFLWGAIVLTFIGLVIYVSR